MNMRFFFWECLQRFTPSLIKGFGVVVEVTIIGFLLSLVLALVLGIGRMSKSRILRGIIIGFVELIRGTPLLVQLFYIYYVISLIINRIVGIQNAVNFTSVFAGILGLGINYGCYQSEVIRSAILAVPRGQTEAGLALGFSERKVLYRIVLPQAIHNTIPVFGNYLVMMVKDTSLLSCIAVSELLLRTQAYAAQTFQTVESYTYLAIAYLIISLPLARLVKIIENKIRIA